MREVVTRVFRKSGSSTRAGGRPFLIITREGRPFLIIVSLQHSTNSSWVDVLIRTVCQLPRHGRFPSTLPDVSTSTGVSAQPPTDIRLRFADVFVSEIKVCLSLTILRTGYNKKFESIRINLRDLDWYTLSCLTLSPCLWGRVYPRHQCHVVWSPGED
jgi:hypothetical protein